MDVKHISLTGVETPYYGSDSEPQPAGEYLNWQVLAKAQPGDVRRELKEQAHALMQDLFAGKYQTAFVLPARIVTEVPDARGVSHKPQPIPSSLRAHQIGGWFTALFKTDLRLQVRNRFALLEEHPDRRVALAAGLLRWQLAVLMVAQVEKQNDTIHLSASTRRRASLADVYADAEQAEETLKRLLSCVSILHSAQALAPYIVPSLEYHRQHKSVLTGLVTQGNALARCEIDVVIEKIKRRAAEHTLDRGFDLSVPYFDEQRLEIKKRTFHVIPPGRIGFVPGFLVRAVHEEQIKVLKDKRLSPRTREHLLEALEMLEHAFDTKFDQQTLES